MAILDCEIRQGGDEKWQNWAHLDAVWGGIP